MASSSAGLWSERTRWGAAVSSPLVTMLLTITLCNVGVIPASSPAYDTVNQVRREGGGQLVLQLSIHARCFVYQNVIFHVFHWSLGARY